MRLLFFLLLPISSFAQDITGVWKGTFYVDSTRQTCQFQLTISEEKGKLTGYSRLEFLQDSVKQIVFREQSITLQNDRVIIEDDKQLKKASTVAQPGELRKVMTMQLVSGPQKMLMSGSWITNKTKRFLTATGTAQIEKSTDYALTEIFQTLDKLKLTAALSFTKPTKNLPVAVNPPAIISETDSTIAAVAAIEKTTGGLPPPELSTKNSEADKIAIPPGQHVLPVSVSVIAVHVPEQEVVLAKNLIATEKVPLAEAEKIEFKNAVRTINKPVQTAIARQMPAAKKTEPTAAVNLPKPAADKKIIDKSPAAPAATPTSTATANLSKKEAAPAKPILVTQAPKTAAIPATAVVAANPLPLAVKKIVPVTNVVVLRKDAALEADKRTISSVQSIYYKTDSLQLTLYDNGEVDGDTVSVLLDGKVIIAKQGLNLKPNVHTIYFDSNTPDSVQLVMYAENLGAIPPNTGLLVIKDGVSVYEVRFSADLSSNAAIVLRRRKKE